MLVSAHDFVELFGNGGEPFEQFLFDLVVTEAGKVGISPTDVKWDQRTNQPDGGRDIKVDANHAVTPIRFIPQQNSVWSAKSGDDGKKPSLLKSEIRDHEKVVAHLKSGGTYVWACPRRVSQGDKEALETAATEIADELKCFNASQIEFRWPEALATITNDNLDLVAIHFPDVVRTRSGVRVLDEFARTDTYGFNRIEWVDSPSRNQLKIRVQEHLKGTEAANVLHIAGLSGVGKTRTVLEACRADEELGGVLYLPSLDALHESLERHLRRSTTSAKLVVDEVPLSKFQRLADDFAEISDRIRIVTIGPARRSQPQSASHPNLLVMHEGTANDVASEIIASSFSSIPKPVANSIVDAAKHDLRLLIMVSRATENSPQFISQPIDGFGDVWERVLDLFKDLIVAPDQFRESYDLLTVGIDVGNSGDFRHELEFLSSTFTTSVDRIDAAIDQASECGLGIKTIQFFESQPAILAAWIFEERMWARIEKDFDRFYESMPSARMQRRFIERCQECRGRHKEAILERTRAFFLNKLGDNNVLALADREISRIFKAWSEFDPECGLGWLHNAVDNASIDRLRMLDGQPDGSGGWRGRRQLVWLCENLACFAEHFWKCEHVLFRLALAETEHGIGNNSTAIWESLFWPILSYTEVPFPDRLDLLLRRFNAASESELQLVTGAWLSLLSDNFSKMAPPPIVGNQIVPQEWRPKTNGELRQLKTSAAELFVQSALEEDDEKRLQISRVICDNLWKFVMNMDVTKIEHLFTQTNVDDSLSRKLRNQIDECFEFFHDADDDVSTEKIAALNDWKKRIAPDSLTERIRDLTARDYWDVKGQERFSVPGQGGQTQYGRLAEEIFADIPVLRLVENWFESDEPKSDYTLATFLGDLDEARVALPTIRNWIKKGTCLRFVSGYLSRISQQGGLGKDLQELLDEISKRTPVYAAQVSLESDFSDIGYRRILNSLLKLDSARELELLRFGYDNWKEVLTDKQKSKLIDSLNELGNRDPQAFQFAIRIISFWRENDTLEFDEPLSNSISQLMLLIEQHNAAIDPRHWRDVLTGLSKTKPVLAIQLATEYLTDFEDKHRYGFREEVVKFLIDIAPEHSDIVMREIGAKAMLPDRKDIFHIDVFRGLFESIDIDILKAWVRENGEDAAVRIARHVESPRLIDEAPFIPELTQWLLEEFEDSDRVFNEFTAGRHSFEVRRPPDVTDLAKLIERTEPFANDPRKRIRQWVEYERASMRHEISWDELDEDRFERT